MTLMPASYRSLRFCKFVSGRRSFVPIGSNVRSKSDAVAKPAVNARIKKRNFFECIGVAAIGEAAIVRFGIDMNTYGPFVEFGKIQDLMDRFFKFDLRRKTVRYFKRVGLAAVCNIRGFRRSLRLAKFCPRSWPTGTVIQHFCSE